MGISRVKAVLGGVLLFGMAAAGSGHANVPTPDGPISIPDRAKADIARRELQRQAARRQFPLSGTPDLARLDGRLAGQGLQLGMPVFLRAFKEESQLEVWMQRDGVYVHFATYPVCFWSGSLGPKLREGDRQTPEGFYSVTIDRLKGGWRWPNSLNLGYPNTYDQALERTGSHILVHGGCASIGCFAMTNPVMREIYKLSGAAIVDGNQSRIPVHVFPFRMTDANIAKYRGHVWYGFWRNLKEGYDAFEETRVLPRIRVCDGRYEVRKVASRTAGQDVGQQRLLMCGTMVAAVGLLDRWSKAAKLSPSYRLRALENITLREQKERLEALRAKEAALAASGKGKTTKTGRAVVQNGFVVTCSLARPSCRKYVALQRRMAAKGGKPRVRTANRAR